MESIAILRPLALNGVSVKSSPWRRSAAMRRHSSLSLSRKLLLCPKASAVVATADISEKNTLEVTDKSSTRRTTFPNGFETLVQEVCDQTEIAEIKLKIGDFEMHLKRDVGAPKVSTSTSTIIEPPTAALPAPSKSMVETSANHAPTPAAKSAPPSGSPFTSKSSVQSKLAALEASGSNAYVLVSSHKVGTFQRARTLKGKKQPPSCKEGDIIKEGQIIGFLEQFENETPVRSDVAGEVLKILFNDGEPVGYGDPLFAVLPSFHSIK